MESKINSSSNQNDFKICAMFEKSTKIVLPLNSFKEVGGLNDFFAQYENELDNSSAIIVFARVNKVITKFEDEVIAVNEKLLAQTLELNFGYKYELESEFTGCISEKNNEYIGLQMHFVKKGEKQTKYVDIREIDILDDKEYQKIEDFLRDLIKKEELVGILMKDKVKGFKNNNLQKPMFSNKTNIFIDYLVKKLEIQDYQIIVAIEQEDNTLVNLYISFTK